MKHDFSGVSKKRLSELFPIILSEHKAYWKKAYVREKVLLEGFFKDDMLRIEHIGSTAIKDLIAKPTIDILVEVKETTDLESVIERMEDCGYVRNKPDTDLVLMLKGYTPNGFVGQAFHIHVRHGGDWDELYFRDYLMEYPDVKKAYETLKIGLKKRHEHDREAYTDAKHDFILAQTKRARKRYGNRYLPARP